MGASAKKDKMADRAIYSDYSFGQLIGPLLDRPQTALLSNLPGERHHFLANRHQIFGEHFVLPFGAPTNALESDSTQRVSAILDPAKDTLEQRAEPIRMNFMHDTGTGKTTLSLRIIAQYLRIPKTSAYVLGFDNTREVFLTDAFKFPELGYVSQAEYAHLLHLRTNYYRNPTPLTRQEMHTFTQRLRIRLISRGKSNGVFFYGYQEFANRCGFVGEESSRHGDAGDGDGANVANTNQAPASVNWSFIDSISGLIVADEITHTYNSGTLNSRGHALQAVLDRRRDKVHLITLSATPMNNHPGESIELAKILTAGVLPSDAVGTADFPHNSLELKRSDYFRDTMVNGALTPQLINEGGFLRLFHNRISAVAATEPHLYPRREWPADSQLLPGVGAPFRFLLCPMSAYQKHALTLAASRVDAIESVEDESEVEMSSSTYFLRDFVLPMRMDKNGVALNKTIGELIREGAQPCLTTGDLIQNYADLDWSQVFDPETLPLVSAKYARFADDLRARVFLGKTMIFHPRVRWGVDLLDKLMSALHYVHAEDGPDAQTPCALCGLLAREHGAGASKTSDERATKTHEAGGRPSVAAHAFCASRYLVVHSQIDQAQRTKIRNMYTSTSNTFGAEYQFIIGSPMIAIGVNFNAIEHLVVHGLIDTYHMLMQLMGRAIRKLSHINLPPERRKVMIHIYVNTDDVTGGTPERYIIKYPVFEAINRVMELMTRISVDYPIFMPEGQAKALIGFDLSSRKQRYYARALFQDELANVYRVIKRLFLIRPIWTYDDFLIAVRAPPFSVNMDLAQVGADTISYVLQKILYRSSDSMYLNMVRDFARTNNEESALFNFEAEAKFFIRGGVICVLIWAKPFLILQPVNAQTRSLGTPLVAQNRIFQYRFNLTDNEVTQLLGSDKPLTIGPKAWHLFHHYDAATHEAAIRVLLEAGAPGSKSEDAHNPSLLKFYVYYGIIRSATEYWLNSLGYRLANGTWISIPVSRPPFAAIMGFYENKTFKILRFEQKIQKSAEANRDHRTIERGSACLNLSTSDVQALAEDLNLPAAMRERDSRQQICNAIEEHLLQAQVEHGSSTSMRAVHKRTHVLFFGPPTAMS